MAKSLVSCKQCKKEFLAENGHINRSIKRNTDIFCSRKCAGLSKRVKYFDKKRCTNCYKILPIDNFRERVQYGRKYIVARCKMCEMEINKQQADIINRRLTERLRFSDPVKRSKKNSFQRNWRKNNIEKNRKYHRINIRKNVKNITDSYLKRGLIRRGYSKDSLVEYPEIIKTYRQILKIKRLLK